ncbi:MAG: hypothetical protein QG656_336, partial [Candidatus Hydrogenedentes bacterium]|nr:hypothetical protein [Candidatus Hydrogenedentota bacterium]
RLYFAEPNDAAPGDRVFHASLQGNRVLTDFDIVAEAGGPSTAVVNVFTGIAVTDKLALDMAAAKENPSPAQAPILQGIEIVREDAEPVPAPQG